MRPMFALLLAASSAWAVGPASFRNPFDRSTPVVGDEVLSECFRQFGMRLDPKPEPYRRYRDSFTPMPAYAPDVF